MIIAHGVFALSRMVDGVDVGMVITGLESFPFLYKGLGKVKFEMRLVTQRRRLSYNEVHDSSRAQQWPGVTDRGGRGG